jgi:NTP pyrophosphatase (non-canonical NTP hydrolase)
MAAWSEIRKDMEMSHLKAVICGSFRRDPAALQNEFQELKEANCTVLSPLDLDFVSEVDGFVFGADDVGRSRAEVEQRHLRSMEEADFVWLHCPDGYVGTSATMELGFAQALGLRVFAADLPNEAALADLVTQSRSPTHAAALSRADSRDAPSRTLLALQSYYAKAAEDRGWAQETAPETLELLKGEVDELEATMGPSGDPTGTALELADVQLYLVHLANILSLDLSEAVRAKERINSARFDRPVKRMAA